jgi:hypothetical protein
MQKQYDALKQLVSGEVAKLTEALAAASSSSSSSSSSSISSTSNSIDGQWFTWGGKMHMVPEKFQLPTVGVREWFNLWYFGNRSTKIGPYRFIKMEDFSEDAQNQACQLSKAKKIIHCIINVARIQGWLQPDETKIEVIEAARLNDIFTRSFAFFVEHLKAKSTNHAYRWSESSPFTLINQLCNPKKNNNIQCQYCNIKIRKKK